MIAGFCAVLGDVLGFILITVFLMAGVYVLWAFLLTLMF